MNKRTPLAAVFLLPELSERHFLVVVLVENLCCSKLKVFLCDVHSALTQSVHTSFCAHTLEFGTRTSVHLLGNLGEVDTTGQIHLSAVNTENIRSGLNTRRGELDLSVDTSWSQESGVENIETIGGHDDLDVLGGLETIKLVQQLQHGSLHFGVSARRALHSRGSNTVDFIHEDDRWVLETQFDNFLDLLDLLVQPTNHVWQVHRTIFAFWVHLDENLLGAHNLDDLTNIGSGLLQQTQLFSQQSYSGVVVVSLGFKTTKRGLTLEDLELHRLDLVVVVLVERHPGVAPLTSGKRAISVFRKVKVERFAQIARFPNWGRSRML
ncbi:hypothetical protein HG531_012580 [Fusarium graminearum]|nr:hypothetical protein HG531_012580 [Fusarium graminearum]